MTGTYFLETEKLDVGYHGQPVVKSISVAVKPGDILTVIGPNGCGKSTFLKTITKQLKTVAGVVRLDQRTLGSISAKELSQKAALVLTDRPRPELMTAGDVVAVGRYPYTGRLGILSEPDHREIDQALQSVGAFTLKMRRFSELSDGQKQKVMLAKAIAQKPEIIILDEPTSYLDIRAAVEILDILRSMATENKIAVIMSLHELNYAKRISDLVMGLKDGQVMYLDRPEAIFREPVISKLYDLPEGVYKTLFEAL